MMEVRLWGLFGVRLSERKADDILRGPALENCRETDGFEFAFASMLSYPGTELCWSTSCVRMLLGGKGNEILLIEDIDIEVMDNIEGSEYWVK